MRHCFAGLLIFASTAASGDAVPGQCISGCNIPNPQQQQQPQAGLDRVFHFQAIQSSSDFWLREAKRPERLPAIGHVNLPIRDQTSLITGPAGNAHFTLADGTAVSMGPGTELVIDRSERDHDVQIFLMHLKKGKFRWSHQSLLQRMFFPKLYMIDGMGAPRGTDFEVRQNIDGSGSVRVYSGVFTYTENNGGEVYVVNPGQELTWQGSKVLGVRSW